MRYNKKAFLRIKEITTILIIFVMCGCYGFLVEESFNIITFIQTMSLITFCFYTVSIFILILNNRKYINNIYKYLSIGFSGVGFLAASNILILKDNFEITSVYGKLSRLFYVISIFEILVFILSFLNIDKKRNIKNLFINVMISTLIATYLVYKSKLHFFEKLQLQGFNETKFIVEMVIILLYIVLIFIIRKNKEKISNKIFLNLIEYSVSRIILSIFVVFTFEQYNIINALITYLIRFIGNYYVFKIIGLEVIIKPNEVLYNDLMIKVFVGSREEMVIVEVHDNGIGIPNEKQKYIFNRYARIKESKSGYKEGSGLGLNIVQEIVNKFNGEIKLESEEGVGTKITLIIPKVEFDEEMYEDYYDDFNFKNDIMQKSDLEM